MLSRGATLLLALAFTLPAAVVEAGTVEDLRELRRAIAASAEPKRRIVLIPRLVAHGEPGAAELLGWLVEHDPTLAIRVAAAQGLGRVRTDNASDILLALLPQGGPRGLRWALADSLARTDAGGQRLASATHGWRGDAAGRRLMLEAMGLFEDDATREILQRHTYGADHGARYAALRALAARAHGDPVIRGVLTALCEGQDDAEYLRELLDVLPPTGDPALRGVLGRLRRHPSADIAREAKRLLGRDPSVEVPARASPSSAAPEDPPDRYGRSEPPFRPTLDVPPVRPPDGKRKDLVVAFDATGSARELLPLVARRTIGAFHALRGGGASARVGVIVFRGGNGRAARVQGIDVLPLTFDVGRVEAFFAEVEVRGTDDRGAAMADGIRQALDRSLWRWGAVRQVHVYADTGCDDPTATLRRVKEHRRGDATLTRFTYFLRTRARVPKELRTLAEAGGAGELELLDPPPPLPR